MLLLLTLLWFGLLLGALIWLDRALTPGGAPAPPPRTPAPMRTLLLLPALLLLLGLAACAGDDPAAGPREDAPDSVTAVAAPLAADTAGVAEIPSVPAEAAEAAATAAATEEAPSLTPAPVAEPSPAPRTDRVQEVAVTVGPSGFEPERIVLEAGVPARLVFTRTAEQTCATEVVVPAFDVGPVPLPLGAPVAVEFTPSERGEFGFACGMGMYRGTLVVGS